MLLFVALCSCLLRSPDGSWRRSWRILQTFHRAAETKLYHWPHVCQRHMRSWDIRRPWLALAYGNEITSSPRSLSQWSKEYALGFAPLTQVSNWSHQQEAVAWPRQQTVLVFRRQHMRLELGHCSLNFQSFTRLQMPNKPAPPLIPAHFAERVHQQVGLAESWNSLSFTGSLRFKPDSVCARMLLVRIFLHWIPGTWDPHKHSTKHTSLEKFQNLPQLHIWRAWITKNMGVDLNSPSREIWKLCYSYSWIVQSKLTLGHHHYQAMTASLASLGVSSDKLDTQQAFSALSCLDSQALLRLRLATVGILDQQIFQDDDQSNVASTRSGQLQFITRAFWGSQDNILLSQNKEEWSTEQRWVHRSSRCCYYWKCSLFIHDTDCPEEFQVQSQILTFGEPLKTSGRGHRGAAIGKFHGLCSICQVTSIILEFQTSTSNLTGSLTVIVDNLKFKSNSKSEQIDTLVKLDESGRLDETSSFERQTNYCKPLLSSRALSKPECCQ